MKNTFKKMSLSLAVVALVGLMATQAFSAEKKKKAATAPAAATTSESHEAAAAAPAHKMAEKKSFSRNYGMAGCGLGSIVMGKRGGQISAATTNATGIQTFAITAGTSNCNDAGSMEEVATRMDRFVVANKVALASDIARGNGEALAGLAQIMNCSNSSRLNSALQSKFGQVFPSHEAYPNEITDNIITVVNQDETLVSSCQLAS